jgi:hypothetical protein
MFVLSAISFFGTASWSETPSTVEAIDLGLSVKWASHNVGASKPEEYGTYFGWGDITGENTSQNNNVYPNANPPDNISDTEYDAAHMLWGGLWKMPTREQAEELVSKCEWKAEKQNGVDGFRVTGKNGNSIFLAASVMVRAFYILSSVRTSGLAPLAKQTTRLGVSPFIKAGTL